MRIATVSHSHIALRQQLFFKEVARQGHDVLMIGPGEWGSLRTQPQKESTFELKTCRHMGGENVYNYRLLGAKDIVEEFKPDWLYVQAEPGSAQADECLSWGLPRKTIFTWENMSLKTGGASSLMRYDLAVCGNPDAERLAAPWAKRTALLLQVGVDTDHFQARPDWERRINVAYFGRRSPEKGWPYLMLAWPSAHIAPWVDYKELPWLYSEVKVVVAYSQDIPFWREQAPNYVVLEALSCGCVAVTSDTAAMAYWLEGCPAVVKVGGHEQMDAYVRPERVEALKKGIQKALAVEVNDEGRRWVMERFSNPVVAKQLLKVLHR